MSCKALPTRPPPTITAGTTLVAVAGVAMAMVLLSLAAVLIEVGSERWSRTELESEMESVLAIAKGGWVHGFRYWFRV